MGVEASNGPESILSAEEGWQAAISRHFLPVDTSFAAGKEVDICPLAPRAKCLCFAIIKGLCLEHINIAVTNPYDPFWFVGGDQISKVFMAWEEL